jgi:hypothetical protein
MIRARISAVAYPVVGQVAVPVDFFDDATPAVVIDSAVYLVTPDAQAIAKLTGLITEGITLRRNSAAGVATFNANVAVGTVVG